MWQDDGGGHTAIFEENGGAGVRFTGADGSKGNALFGVSGPTAGTRFYSFSLTGPPGTWIGACTKDRFAPGWRLKGLLYGGPGNLSDGSALVTGQWGPEFGDGDSIGMLVEQGDSVRIQYTKNGVGLGPAFNIAGWSSGDLYPCVSFDTEGQGVVVKEAPPPPSESFLKPGFAGGGIEGSWEGRYTLKIQKDAATPSSYSVSIKVGNVMNGAVEGTPEGGHRLVGPMMSSRMMPPPHLYALEQEVQGMMGELKGFKREGGSLVMEARGGRVERFSPSGGPPAATRDLVHWLNE